MTKTLTPLRWVSTPAIGQGRSSGGSTAAELFETGSSQRRRPLIETLVREICQNSIDQRIGEGKAKVFFDLILLTGKEKEKFLEAFDWNNFLPHISSVSGTGGAALTLKAGVEALNSETLVCLRISDSGTRGLTGDDWDEDGNFRRLCVQNFSTGEVAGRGGSFGLGKAVSWMHSRLLTVLFSSEIDGRNDEIRLFGRSEIPAHELDGNSWLDGAYLGKKSKKDGISVALSDWRTRKEAKPLLLDRDGINGTGTSLLIPAFHEPDREDTTELGIRDPEYLCKSLTAAAAKWFWPAISWGRLEVQARLFRNDCTNSDFVSKAVVDSLWKPFLETSRQEPEVTIYKAVDPGDTSTIDIDEFSIPARIQPVDNPALLHPSFNTSIRLGVTRVSDSEACLPCRSTIALVRGSGMVIDYVDGNRLPDGGVYCAAAFVGSALKNVPESDVTIKSNKFAKESEEYFRAAEPVTHDDWLPTTRRLRESYQWRGFAKRLKGLRSEIRQLVIHKLLLSFDSSPDEGPELLMRMLNRKMAISSAISKSSSNKPKLEVVINREKSSLLKDEGVWKVSGHLIRSGIQEGTAIAGLCFKSISDSGIGESWDINDIRFNGLEKEIELDDSESRRIVFSVGSKFQDLSFSCLVKPPAGVDPKVTGFKQGA